MDLHRKYGAIVRIAPEEYSVNDGEAVRVIYGLGNGFVKVIYLGFDILFWRRKLR